MSCWGDILSLSRIPATTHPHSGVLAGVRKGLRAAPAPLPGTGKRGLPGSTHLTLMFRRERREGRDTQLLGRGGVGLPRNQSLSPAARGGARVDVTPGQAEPV